MRLFLVVIVMATTLCVCHAFSSRLNSMAPPDVVAANMEPYDLVRACALIVLFFAVLTWIRDMGEKREDIKRWERQDRKRLDKIRARHKEENIFTLIMLLSSFVFLMIWPTCFLL